MEAKILKKASLGELFTRINASGARIMGPCKRGEKVLFEQVSSPSEMTEDYIQTTVSPKAAVFPKCEELFKYKAEDGQVQLEQRPPVQPTVLFGARPCDAASIAVLNSVFSWDPKDELFAERLEKLTLISVACTRADKYCFCTSIGLSPGDTRGSDIQLTPIAGDEYYAEILTPKGEAIVALAPQLFAAPTGQKKAGLAEVPNRFDLKKLEGKLPDLFKREDLWMEQSLRCLGCGACAYVCPTCVCFDIQDETGGKSGTGTRLRCWDSCGLSLFTLHTSGHNPRSKQSARWRQRVMHKFSYFPQRLEQIGCVGCGRCSRGCPADMDIAEHLVSLAETE